MGHCWGALPKNDGSFGESKPPRHKQHACVMFPGPGLVDVHLPYFQDLVWDIVGAPFPKMMVALENQNHQDINNMPVYCFQVLGLWMSLALLPGPGMGHCWGALPKNDGSFGESKPPRHKQHACVMFPGPGFVDVTCLTSRTWYGALLGRPSQK